MALMPMGLADEYIDVQFRWEETDTTKTINARSGLTISCTSNINNVNLSNYEPISIRSYTISNSYVIAARGVSFLSTGGGGQIFLINTSDNNVTLSKEDVNMYIRYKKK